LHGSQSKILLVFCTLLCKLWKTKIANLKEAIVQRNIAVDHKRNENAAAGVGGLKFPVVKNLSLLKLRK